MPTYQYRCTECGHDLDVQQSFTDEALTVCPECAGKLRKVFAAVGVVFKGSGFYKTDSRAADAASKSAEATASSKDSGTAGASNSDGGKSDGGKSDSGTSTKAPAATSA